MYWSCALRWAVLTVLWIWFCLTGPISIVRRLIYLCLSVCILCVFVSYCIFFVVLWAKWGGPDVIEALSLGPIFLQCFDTVGWVPDMTYNVFGGTLNLSNEPNHNCRELFSFAVHNSLFVVVICRRVFSGDRRRRASDAHQAWHVRSGIAHSAGSSFWKPVIRVHRRHCSDSIWTGLLLVVFCLMYMHYL